MALCVHSFGQSPWKSGTIFEEILKSHQQNTITIAMQRDNCSRDKQDINKIHSRNNYERLCYF